MNIDDIRELIALMKENQISEVDVETGDQKVRIKATDNMSGIPSTTIVQSPVMPVMPAANLAAAPEPAQLNEPAVNSPAHDSTAGGMEEEGIVITSPIVGVFYRAASPDKPSFVDEGDEIDTNSVLCIIEAMKVMNEIKAETSGRIKSILIDNGQAVEYGQPLFIIERPD